jgi:DNA-binding MarR family transcriptional regulator
LLPEADLRVTDLNVTNTLRRNHGDLHLEDCSPTFFVSRLPRRIDRVMRKLIEARFASHDVSFMQWVALKTVRDGLAQNPSELAQELSITTGATTRMIDQLERRGLINRYRDRSDRRVVRLAITQAGQTTTAELACYVVDTWNEVLVGFEQSDFDQMIAALIRLHDAAKHAIGSPIIL